MKRILVSLACLVSLVNLAHADEGMWTLYNLPTAVYEQMKQYGFELPMEQLYQSDNAVKNAVVNFGGFCTGVVVSPDGLVFTNHHCGFDAIRQHSTVEHDYMLNGFVSKSYEEELPNEDLFVSFMIDQKDSKVIAKHINPGENIYYIFPAQKNPNVFNIFSTCLIALTDKRLLIAQKNILWGYKLSSITPDMFNDFEVFKGLIFGKIDIDTVKELIRLSDIDPRALTEIETNLSEYLLKVKPQAMTD